MENILFKLTSEVPGRALQDLMMNASGVYFAKKEALRPVHIWYPNMTWCQKYTRDQGEQKQKEISNKGCRQREQCNIGCRISSTCHSSKLQGTSPVTNLLNGQTGNSIVQDFTLQTGSTKKLEIYGYLY